LSYKNKFPYISITDEVSDFKFGKKLKLAKTHHQNPPEETAGVPWARGAPQNLGVAL